VRACVCARVCPCLYVYVCVTELRSSNASKIIRESSSWVVRLWVHPFTTRAYICIYMYTSILMYIYIPAYLCESSSWVESCWSYSTAARTHTHTHTLSLSHTHTNSYPPSPLVSTLFPCIWVGLCYPNKPDNSSILYTHPHEGLFHVYGFLFMYMGLFSYSPLFYMRLCFPNRPDNSASLYTHPHKGLVHVYGLIFMYMGLFS